MIDDDIFITEFKKTYYQKEMPKIRKAIAELKAEMGDWGRQRRLSYLLNYKNTLQAEINAIYASYEQHSKLNNPYLERYIMTIRLNDLEKELIKVKSEIKYLKAILKGKANNDRISPEMIQMAKEYPIENLIEVKHSKALCPFHDDHNPSMGIKNNRFYCFACGESGDVIDFVMKKEGLNFTQAVKFLT